MARPLRIQFENAYYHVTCRGNARQEIFLNDADYARFLRLLERSSDIYQVDIIAYVLMMNHFHLLLKTPLANLQEFMRHFNISYTSYYNRSHQKTGHLYQGRYKSFLIDADHHLQEVSRYIHLNPVRVKGKSNLNVDEKRKYLKQYLWSTYPGYISTRARESFVCVNNVLGYFGGNTSQGKRKYERFVEEGLSKEVENPLERGKGHGVVGSIEFMERIKQRFLSAPVQSRELPAVRKILGQVEPEKIIRVTCKEMGVTREDLLKRGSGGIARGFLMELLYRYGGMNQREIGELMGIDYSAVSVSRKRFDIFQKKDKSLLKQVEKIKTQLSQG
ncbi:MAG: transposase [Desulfobacterales bacterium]|nr:transposase [Desulfobacterales bacterium]